MPLDHALEDVQHTSHASAAATDRLHATAAAADVPRTQMGTAQSTHLQRLEAAAAKWQHRSGSGINSSQLPGSGPPSLHNQYRHQHPLDASSSQAPSWQTQQELNGSEHFEALMDSWDRDLATDVVLTSPQSAVDVHEPYADASLAALPPAPPRPVKGARVKASWWDALKGDAPPWLL